jgi:predicted DNA-binding transcriptional regulator AlpA
MESVMHNASLSPPKPVIGRKLGGVNAVAAKCDCSTRTVYRLSDAGRMPPPIKLGSLVRWDLDEIDEWIAAGCPAVRNAKGAGR